MPDLYYHSFNLPKSGKYVAIGTDGSVQFMCECKGPHDHTRLIFEPLLCSTDLEFIIDKRKEILLKGILYY